MQGIGERAPKIQQKHTNPPRANKQRCGETKCMVRWRSGVGSALGRGDRRLRVKDDGLRT